jgi:hypothetical protein
MRKIILVSLLLLVSQFCFAQTEPWWAPIKFNTEGNVEFQNTYDLEGKSQEELYSITKVWLSEMFKNSKNVIEVDEKDSGIISGNGNNSFTSGSLLLGLTTETLYFSFKCQIKDGRFRLTLNNFELNNQYVGRYGVEGQFTDKSIKKNGDVKDFPNKIKSEILSIYGGFVDSLEKNLLKEDDF